MDLFCKYGFKPSAHKPKWTFLLSASKSGWLVLIWSHCGESYGPCIFPSFDIFVACHVINNANCGVENICLRRGMTGKCLSTLNGTLDCPTLLNRGALHRGHISKSTYPALNNTHPFRHASIALYSSPSRPSILLAMPSLRGSELGDGKITVDNNYNISFIHAFVVL